MADAVNDQIVAQGNKIREMKEKKADKASIKAEVDVLLALKAEYKGITGQDWKPPAANAGKKESSPAAPTVTPYKGGALSEAEKAEMTSAAAAALDLKIQQCGDVVRKLKADKAAFTDELEVLKFLKNCYKERTGGDWVPLEKRAKENKKPESKQAQQQPKANPEEKSEKQLKREAKKQEKKAKKEQHKSTGGGENEQSAAAAEEDNSGPDVSEGRYGNLPMNQSREKIERKLADLSTLTASANDKDVWVRARLHTSRAKGKQCFFVLRQQQRTVQGIAFVNETTSKQMVKFISQ